MKKIFIFWLIIWVVLTASYFLFYPDGTTYWGNKYEDANQGTWLEFSNKNIYSIETSERYFGYVSTKDLESKKLEIAVGDKLVELESTQDYLLVDVEKENPETVEFDLSVEVNPERIYVYDNYYERNLIEKTNIDLWFDYLDAARYVIIEKNTDVITGDSYINEIILSLN